MIARLGGEEFCIILPYTSQDQAKQVAVRLQEAIKEEPIIVDGLRVSITLSAGVSLVSSCDQDGHDAVDRADQKLLHAKKLGRDQVCA
jgi:diguanylate cyclase (GGDEF)-like protein